MENSYLLPDDYQFLGSWYALGYNSEADYEGFVEHSSKVISGNINFIMKSALPEQALDIFESLIENSAYIAGELEIELCCDSRYLSRFISQMYEEDVWEILQKAQPGFDIEEL